MRRYIPYLVALCVLLLVTSAHITHAATSTDFVPLANLNTEGGSKLAGLYDTNSLPDYLNKIFQFAIVIGAIAAVFRLMYAGYLYMGSADMWSTKGKAKEVIGDVTLGLILLLTVWIILYQINPDILKLNALRNLQPVQLPASGASGQGTSGEGSAGGGGSGW